jgi:hypothetical protein
MIWYHLSITLVWSRVQEPQATVTGAVPEWDDIWLIAAKNYELKADEMFK